MLLYYTNLLSSHQVQILDYIVLYTTTVIIIVTKIKVKVYIKKVKLC